MQKTQNLLLTTFLLLIVGSLFAQDRVVTGKVSDRSDGESIPGANVLVKGTSNGVTTDLEGNYSIQVFQDDAVLVFSFIGYKTQFNTDAMMNIPVIVSIFVSSEGVFAVDYISSWFCSIVLFG